MSAPYYPSNRLSSEAARIRFDAIDEHFSKPGGTRLYSTDKLGLPVDPDSPQGMADRYRVTRAFAESSAPVEHLNGLQFVHVLKAGGIPGDPHGVYFHPQKTMALNDRSHFSIQLRKMSRQP